MSLPFVTRLIGIACVVIALDRCIALVRLRGPLPRSSRPTAPTHLWRRLDQAMVGMSPRQWWAAQLVSAVPLGTLLIGSGVAVVSATVTAISGVRLGAALVLWLRRDALDEAVRVASARLARCLAAELNHGGSLAAGLTSAVAGEVARGDPVVTGLLADATGHVEVGEEAPTALRGALDRLQGRLRTRSLELDAVVTVLRLQGGHGAMVAPLLRLADTLDAVQRAADQARAATAEPRLAAAAIPILTVATAAMIVSVEPAAVTGVLSLPALFLLGGCALTAGTGVSLVRRVTQS